MQKGIVTFELILVTLIIVILAKATVPNAVRVLDRVALDYETKRLYTELRNLQAFDRITDMRDSHFKTYTKNSVHLLVTRKNYVLEKNDGSTVYVTHKFSNGVTANKSKIISFDDMGKLDPATSDTLILTSQLGKQTKMVFDSVGRFRGGRQ